MFGWKIIHKRELALYAAQIDDSHQEIIALRKLVEHERKRAEGAINLLLMRTQKAALSPEPTPMTEEQEEAVKAKMLNIFGDEYEETKFLDEVQNVR
jgi:hypothetical protein